MPDPSKGNNAAATVIYDQKIETPDALVVPASSEFKRKSARGGAATIVGQVVGMVLQIGTAVVLARILSPTDYGLQSMVITLTAFFTLFRDAGLTLASVQRENLTHEEVSTLFWINVGLGTFLTIVVAASAPFLVWFYKEPRLFWVTIASSFIFLISSLSAQQRALLDRGMRFSTNVAVDIFSSVVGTVVAIGMAMAGFGYWSLFWQNISIPLVATIAVWIIMPWWPTRPRWTPALRSMVHFGGTLTLNSFVVYVAYNTEKVLLGRSWGAAPLGIYSRAYQLANLPVQQLFSAAYVVAFSVLSRLQGDEQRLQRAYLKSQSAIISLTIPVVIGSALFANEIVLVLLGAKWMPVAGVLRMLAPTILVFALVNPFAWLLQATGRVGRSLGIAVLIAPVVIAGVLAGLHGGPSGVATGYSVAMVLLFVPIVLWAKHGTGITAVNYWDSVKRPIISGVLGGAAGWVARYFLAAYLKPIPLLALELTAFSVVYLAVLLFVMKQKDFYFDLAKEILGRRMPSTAEV